MTMYCFIICGGYIIHTVPVNIIIFKTFVHFYKYSKEYHILQDSLIQIQFEITSSSVVMEPIKSIKEY